MTPTTHGGNVYAAARELRVPLGKLVDFSASINPLGPSPAVFEALRRARPLVPHYPDPDCWSLKRVLASRLNVDPAELVVGNGSIELIDLLPRALKIRRALIIGPTFSEYAAAVERAGGRCTGLVAVATDGYRPPLEEAIERVRRFPRSYDAVFLCNPNSPTGRSCPAKSVLDLAGQAERAGVWTVVDETFAEYCERCSVLPALTKHSRLIVLRSFTKFYALPGLRIGYAAASRSTARVLHHRRPAWSVNAAAQLAAMAALSDRSHAERSLSFMDNERDRLRKRLGTVAGLGVIPSEANFFLLELPSPHKADRLTEALRRQGLLIRDCTSVPGLNARTVRIAVRRRRENDRLVKACRSFLE